MHELSWMLKLADHEKVTLRSDVAEDLGVDTETTVGEIRHLIQPPEPKQIKMIEIDSDLNMEF